MADEKKQDDRKSPGPRSTTIDPNHPGSRTDGDVLTTTPEKDADKTSYPVASDAVPEDPPVRTTQAGVNIVAAIGSGAGEHVPPDPDLYYFDGRPKPPAE